MESDVCSVEIHSSHVWLGLGLGLGLGSGLGSGLGLDLGLRLGLGVGVEIHWLHTSRSGEAIQKASLPGEG